MPPKINLQRMATSRLISNFLQEVRTRWPYWNRTNGADHIFTVVSDLGGCEIEDGTLENATMLLHFGRVVRALQGYTAHCDFFGEDEKATDACDPVSDAKRNLCQHLIL